MPRMRAFGNRALLAASAGVALSSCAIPAESYLYTAVLGAALGVAIVAIVVQLNTPVAGLTLLLISAVLVPVEFRVNTAVFNVCLPIAAFLCGCLVLRVLISRRHIPLDASPVVMAASVFLAVAVLSFVAGQYPWFPTGHAPIVAQVGGLSLFLLSGGLFLVVGHEVTRSRQLEHLTWVFVVTGALAVVTSLVSAFDFRVASISVTNASSIGSGFWTWLVAISLSQALFNRALSLPARVGVGLVATVALVRGLFIAFDWVSGWLPPLTTAGVLILVRFPRWTIVSALGALVPALLYAGPVLKGWMAAETYSSMTRVEALRVMWQLVQQNPWLGYGPANYYHYTPLFPILGWWVRFNSHNNYVDLIGQIGVIGLVVFGWFIVEVVRVALTLRSRVRPGFEHAYVLGVIAGLAGSLVSGLLADWIIPFAYNVGVRGFRSSLLFWFFLGGLLALKRTISPTLAFQRRGGDVWPSALRPRTTLS